MFLELWLVFVTYLLVHVIISKPSRSAAAVVAKEIEEQ